MNFTEQYPLCKDIESAYLRSLRFLLGTVMLNANIKQYELGEVTQPVIPPPGRQMPAGLSQPGLWGNPSQTKNPEPTRTFSCRERKRKDSEFMNGGLCARPR